MSFFFFMPPFFAILLSFPWQRQADSFLFARSVSTTLWIDCILGQRGSKTGA
jgi:hypothetical protein